MVGSRSVGTPGTLLLLETAHHLHGRLPWARLVQPAIDLAEQGFEVSPRLHELLAREAETGRLTRYEPARSYFFTADGAPRPVGSVLRNPEFAETLRLIRDESSTTFYHGEIGQDIVAAVRGAEGNPGLLGPEDLADYRVKLREPVCGLYRAHRVCSMGPPS